MKGVDGSCDGGESFVGGEFVHVEGEGSARHRSRRWRPDLLEIAPMEGNSSRES